ncbi:MAG TPA: alpha-ketoacid dehydrogenase subunit beta [Acidimicrobiia bacterium]|nr:alpha-ketoacid dehydrogenase subunit beta [Acidimicrobiia bacterium]
MSENFGFSEVEASEGRSLTYLEAISEAIAHEMERDPDVLVMGEDVGGEFGGAFKVTKGLAARFGDDRVLNTPIAELGFTGMANGMALMGMRPIVEMQFADFISTAFDSIVQFAATAHYRWGGRVPWVIRAPSDGGIRSGPYHSQNPEAWFVHTPGLKVVAPSTPADAKGLLTAAVRDDNPVIFFEAKPLYRSIRGHVPEGEHLVPIGQAATVRQGDDVTVITYGSMVHVAMQAADSVPDVGVRILDLRTLKPLDTEAVLEAARATGKVLVLHAANRNAGVGAEVAALIAEEAFESLDGPIVRLGGADTPVPFSPPLEDAYRPSTASVADAIKTLAAY